MELVRKVRLNLKMASKHKVVKYTSSRDAYSIVLSKRLLNELARCGIDVHREEHKHFYEVLCYLDDKPCIMLIPEEHYYKIISEGEREQT